MLLDFNELLAEMPKNVSDAVLADIQETVRERASRQDSEVVAYSAPDQVECHVNQALAA